MDQVTNATQQNDSELGTQDAREKGNKSQLSSPLPTTRPVRWIQSSKPYGKALLSSRDWQSLRRSGGDTLNSMEIPALRNRTRGSRRVMHADAIRVQRITPQPHADFAEGADVRQCVRANCFGQDNKRLMGEEPVTTRLTHGPSPVRQLKLKGAGTGSCDLNESFRAGEGLARKRLPRHRQHVCYAVPVHRDFTCDNHAVIFSCTVYVGCLTQIGPCERNREPVFGRCYAFTSWQVSLGFREPDLRDNDSGFAHRFPLSSRLPTVTRSYSGSVSADIYIRVGCPIRGSIVQRPLICVNVQRQCSRHGNVKKRG